METFVLLGCNQFTSNGMKYLAKRCSNIKTFCISSGSFRDVGLKSVVKNLPQLNSLNIKDCDSLTDKGVRYIGLSKSNIKELNLENCHQITDSSIRYIARNCQRIESINLSGCWEITDNAILEITTELKNLKYLNISKCSNLTDTALSYIHEKSKSLETLVISETPINVTSDGLCQLVKNLPDLRDLNMMYSSEQVNDDVVQAVSENSRTIKNLNVNSCHKITDVSLLSLGLHCFSLEMLNIVACYQLTAYQLLNLQQSNPKLKIIGFEK